MKHFLPVNAGDTERGLELIYVSEGQASRAACLIGVLSCAWGWDWDRDHQGKPVSFPWACPCRRRHIGQGGFRYSGIGRFTPSPYQELIKQSLIATLNIHLNYF